MKSSELSCLQWAFADLASQAGVAVMEIYADPQRTVRSKSDGSPVCDADERAEEIIVQGLERILPGVPVLAEESASRDGIDHKQNNQFILVDPVDGTREFIKGTDEFTINIALVEGETPLLGCVYAPALGEMYLGVADTALQASGFVSGSRVSEDIFSPVRARRSSDRITVVASRSHLDPQTEGLLKVFPVDRRLSAGSSLKFCMLATGQADLYPRFGTTMEWDTAAGHAVLQAAGGEVRMLDGEVLFYNKRDEGFKNGAFIAYGTDGYKRFGKAVACYGEEQ